jgi:hypothetical protein
VCAARRARSLFVRSARDVEAGRSTGRVWCVARAAQAQEKRRGAGEREIHARMRVFARLMPHAEHQALVGGLLLEQRLRTTIAEVKEQRRAGVRTFSEAEGYELVRPRGSGFRVFVAMWAFRVQRNGGCCLGSRRLS